ncbi:hypothetical protein [Smaragdicoccus niigatensis]|uniref:hypothetical protein n=1 Tax=Smaragdicoccus niigatensis TaxID=359359 RepID=UPI00037E7F76|nr:hypothetical protein [Smaragdicoccus niigatensis]
MTIAIDTHNFRSSTPFDPERWRRTYAGGSRPAAHTGRSRRAPRREFSYGNAFGYTEQSHQELPEQTINIVTLIVAALLTALVVVGLVAIADFASGGGMPGGFPVAAAVAGAEGGR